VGSSWRWAMKVAVVGLAFVVGWNTLLGFIFSPSGIYDGSALPSRLHVCGRTWNKGGPQTLEAIVADYSPGPTLVAPILAGFLSACPSAACSGDSTHFPCDTVVYVRIGDDAYMGYGLAGGP
jgi:hypothetical protein